jgi:hypothetical protein
LRWVKLGDKNTEFFHSIATISHKKNFIVSLTNQERNQITDHDQKANLLWTAFKERMEKSDFTRIAFNLSSMLTEHDLDCIDSDFNPDEIDMVIKTLPNNHVPGPDGFNGFFVKKC